MGGMSTGSILGAHRLDCNLAVAGTCFIPAETFDEPASTRFGQRDPLQRVRKSDRGFARAKRKGAGHRDNSSFFPKNGRTACPLALGTAVAASKTESIQGEGPWGREACPVRSVPPRNLSWGGGLVPLASGEEVAQPGRAAPPLFLSLSIACSVGSDSRFCTCERRSER